VAGNMPNRLPPDCCGKGAKVAEGIAEQWDCIYCEGPELEIANVLFEEPCFNKIKNPDIVAGAFRKVCC